MGEMIDLTASCGHIFQAYLTGDPRAPRGIVVVQEIFGVNRHMRRVCDELAGYGYQVVAPALFDRVERGVELGYTAADIERGLKLREPIEEAAALRDIEAAAAKLAPRPTGIIGYCWGGTIAWLGATRSKAFKAAIGWYGGGIRAARDARPNCPVQCISAPRTRAFRWPMSRLFASVTPKSRFMSMTARDMALAARNGRASIRARTKSPCIAASPFSRSISPST